MPIEITMPRLSDTMEEGTLVKWHVSVGDSVSAGDHLADVETDKATMELQAFEDGTVARIAIEEGSTVPVGDLILMLAGEGESVEDAAKAVPAEKTDKGDQSDKGDSTDEQWAKKQPQEEKQATAQPGAATQPAEAASADGGGGGTGTGGTKASPLARKLAEEHGVDLAQIEGSGPGGRVIKRDVLAAAEGKAAGRTTPQTAPQTANRPAATSTTAPAPAPAAKLESKAINLSGMRKTIAKRLVESKTTVPHFQVSMLVNMDPLMDLRKTLNAQLESQGIKLSVNDFIVRASALACVQHPAVNSSWAGDTIQQHGTVNVGIAVALPEERGGGLIVPVLRDVQNLGLRSISEQTRAIAKKAREQGLTPEEMSDGTFTVSNLGMYGVDHFTAIINPPQAAILAIGAALEKPVVRDGQIVVGHEMTLTLSGDHRVLDGAVAAEYLQTLKSMLENPAGLLV